MVLLNDRRQKIKKWETVKIIFPLLLLFVLCNLSSVAHAEEKAYLIHIEGMHCNMCVYRVTKSLKKLRQVKDVEVSLENGTAAVTLNDGEDVSKEALEEAVENSGYKPVSVEELKK